MKLLEERILSEGTVLPGNVLKVGSFLNQRIDTRLLREMARETARLFAGEGITKVITVESSGIAFATAIAMEMDVPVLFAKKHQSSNVDGEVLSCRAHSYTHNVDYNMVISREYLSDTDHVLLADDFLASGAALLSLTELVNLAGASLAGAAICIEKKFQGGGDALREKGVRVESLALIESMDDGTIKFAHSI